MMIREPSEERGSFRSIPRDDKRVDTVSGSFPIRTGSKVNLQESAKTLEQQQSEALVMISGSMTKFPAAPRHGSMLSSLKAQYRKLRTFKGTIRALINLKRSPLLNTVKTTTPAIPSLNDDQRRHVVAEIDSTLGTEVAYRQQGNLDLYTKDNLAKRVSLQQHPHMIALTQRLWNCALRNGDKKLTFPDYETYMLCLHRLILPEFDIGASKELIRDDWKRDSGEQNYLDYPFFHLSMFELVDLWTDTVDPDDYVSLLYCITHCLTYLLDERHVQKSLEGVSLEDIKQDLQRELASDAFAYYRDQIKLATKTTQNAEQGRTSSRRQSQSKQRGNESLSRTQSRGSNELSSPRRQSHSQQGDSRRSSRGANESSNLRRQSLSQQGGNESSSRSQSREGKRSSSRSEEKDETVMKSINAGPSPLTALNYPVSSLRKQTGLQRATSPNAFSRGGGVVLNIGMMEGMMISKSIADGKPGVAVSTSGMAAFPRRRSRSVSNSSQHRRDQIMQAVSGKVDSPREPSQSSGLHVSHIEASGSTLRTGIQDPNAPGYLLIQAQQVQENPENPLHSLTAPLITIVSSKAPTPREAPSINKFNLQLQEIQTIRPQNPYEGRSGASISSPRASNAITAQAIGIFISSHQQPVKPPTSPRPTLILSSDHQAPMNPRNLQQYQKNEGLSLVTTGPGSMPVKSMSLAISGRPVAPNITVETIQQEPSKPNTGKSTGLLGENLGSSDGVTVVSHPNGDLKALLSPRYIVAEPVVSHHPSPISNLKQPSVRPHGSTRGFAVFRYDVRDETSGLLWWDEELAQPSVSFRTAFFPALLCVCDPQSLPSELSRDELRVVTQFCISSNAHQSDLVTKEDFRRFIARFGPLELSLSKLVACFCVNRELVPWFHGEIGRDEAESVLSTRERSDGAFLVRFSESHPTKFTLTYLKVHSASSNTPGRRELKNCLVNNLGMTGYALTEAVRRGGAGSSVRQRTYPSIGAFIQSSSGRLKYGVASEFSATCNQELAMVRAMQDQQSDSNTSGAISDSYTSFTLDSLAPPTVHRVEIPANAPPSCQYEDKKLGHGNWSDGNVASASGSFTSGDYGSFASFAQQLQPEEEAQPTAAQGSRSTDSPLHHLHRPPAAVFDDLCQSPGQRESTRARSHRRLWQLCLTGRQTRRQETSVEQTLGPPPPPMVKKSSFDTTKASSTDVYGDFAALSLAGNGASTHKGQAPAPKSLPAAPNSDVYGSFDPTASSPATKTTPTTSALDELNVGMEFYKQKRLDDALLRFMLAQEMARATGDQVVEARALGNLGTVYLDKKNPHQAVRCYQHCLDITRAIEDTKRERTILNNLVLALVASEDFERALACCQVQLETTTNAINRSKIISRMSLLREKMARQTTS
ncbi:Tetratricopeptide repeat [Phytophthora cactorum]|nr:Tetratricopeptide repeat [Phytophthora cactorum]